MGRSRAKLLWLIIMMLGQMAAAQNGLNNAQLESLIRRLTQDPKEAWLTQGTLTAVHTRYQGPAILSEEEILAIIEKKTEDYKRNTQKPQEAGFLQDKYLEAIPFNVCYDYQNESTTVTTEYIEVRGKKFFHSTRIESHTDSISPTPAEAKNHFINVLNLKTNRTKIFSYDGKRDTRYIRSANYALVEDSLDAPKRPKALRAGLIPWGTGMFSQEAILDSTPSASIRRVNGKRLVHLEFHNKDVSVSVALDPQKSLAVVDCTIENNDGSMITQYSLSQYVRFDRRWIPNCILVERHIPENDQYRLLKSDLWQLDILGASTRATTFSPRYDDKATVEYRSPKTRKPLRYRYRKGADTDTLLTRRLATLSDKRPQNCASTAIEYIADRLGKPLGVPASTLIDYAGTSTLYDMQQYLNAQGFHAKAVRTSLDELPIAENCFAIISLPHINHYLLIDSIDEHNVWIIDLTSNEFYTSYPKDAFQDEWIDGVALLVSDQGVITPAQLLDTFDLKTITGGAGYQCTHVVQGQYQTFCPLTTDGLCIGFKEVFYEYRICDSAPFGECFNDKIVLDRTRHQCKGDAIIPEKCELEIQIWFFLDWACQGTLPPRA